MNFVADENVDRQIVKRLRDDGHSVWYIAEMSPSISDDEVLQHANNGTAPLITSDNNFGELVFRQHLVSYSITNHENEIFGNFTVISPSRIRIRKI